MKNELLNDIKAICKKHKGTLLEYRKLGKVVKYEIAIPGTDIRIGMENRKGGAL